MNKWTALLASAVADQPNYGLLPIIIPSLIAVLGVVATAWLMRRTNRESNKTEAKKGDTNAFEVVTNQLFRLNEDLTERLTAVEGEVSELKGVVAMKEAENTGLQEDLEDTQKQLENERSVTRQLANYIKQLITAWPINVGPPPTPDPPIDWKLHL